MFVSRLALIVGLLVATVMPSVAAEPLIGTWHLVSQTVKGQKQDPDRLTLRIYQSGDSLEFAYSVPINNINFVGTRFTSVHIDGPEGDIKDGQSNKIGTVKLTRTGPMQYQCVIQGHYRPTASTKLTLSNGGKTLTSESIPAGSAQGPPIAVQVFSRD